MSHLKRAKRTMLMAIATLSVPLAAVATMPVHAAQGSGFCNRTGFCSVLSDNSARFPPGTSIALPSWAYLR